MQNFAKMCLHKTLSLFAILSIGAFSPVFAQTASTEGTAVSVDEVTPEHKFADALQALFSNGGSEFSDFSKFYASRDFQPLWADGGTKALLALLTAIEQAPDHGMTVERYNTDAIEVLWMQASSPEDMATLEFVAAQSFVKFAQELSSGFLDPRTVEPKILDEKGKPVDRQINVRRQIPKATDLLAGIAGASDMRAFYKSLQPSSSEYAKMLALKVELEAAVKADAWGATVPVGPTLRPGQSSERVAALRARLARRGYALADTTSPTFDDDLTEAVKAAQRDLGLNADGLVGSKTLASFNLQPTERLKQVLVNLERLRWMNYDLGKRHIYVNIPDYMAAVVDEGKSTLSFRVVVGTDENPTAEFSDTMTHMVANPTWYVPYSIASEEYLPDLQNDPTILQRNNIRMLVIGSKQIVNPLAIDYSLFTEETFPFLLEQLPGETNALGRVKFMFPNKYNIYLHDTPSRNLFAKDARAFSHGCVRVQKPMELAYTLLSLQEEDPVAAFHDVLDTKEETQINLDKPIPVHIVYRTVSIDSSNTVHYRDDIYGRDKIVYDALIEAGVTSAALEG